MHVHSGGDGSRSAAEPAAVLSLSSVLVLSYQLVGGAGLERLRLRRVAELQLLVLTMTVLSSWLWWWWRVTAVTCCPAQCQLTTVWPALVHTQQTAWHWPHTGTTSTLVTLVVVSSLPPASTCSITLGRLRLSTWPPQEIQETQEPGGGRGVLVAARALRVLGGLL